MRLSILFSATLFIMPAVARAQAPGRPPAPAQTPKDSAPIDLTGYWVSVIDEDWHWRMITPPKGDYQSVPMTMEAKKVADQWDPAADEAAGNQCKSYGAAGIMRQPERLHVTWQDNSTLRMDIDAGTQTRTFHFGEWKSPDGQPSLQGDSLARWEIKRGEENPSGNLKVTTSHLKAGYLRKNGVPYSERTTMTEYYDLVREPDGSQWLVITSIVEDPVYLQQPFILSTHFKKQADAKGWDPTPCSATW
jgi:hypothetical protein